MADLLREDGTGTEARVVSADELWHELGETDRERILDRLNSRTVGEIEGGLALRRAAEVRLAGYERRSGWDRRSGRDRRSAADTALPRVDRRVGHDRRSGRDRRQVDKTYRSGVR